MRDLRHLLKKITLDFIRKNGYKDNLPPHGRLDSHGGHKHPSNHIHRVTSHDNYHIHDHTKFDKSITGD